MDLTRELKNLASLITCQVAESHHYERPSRHPSLRNYGFTDYSIMFISFHKIFMDGAIEKLL